MSSMGVVKGQIILDARQALATYTLVRQANIKTVTAVNRGAAVTRQAGMIMLGGGTALALGLGIAIKKAADFEKQMDFFGAVSSSTAKEMEGVRQKALQLGADTRYSAGEIADSFVELGKAGVSAKNIIEGIGEAVANLGAAADIPLADAAQIISAQVATFNLKAKDAITVADKLAGAANASMVDVSDLGVSLKYAGGVASSLGVPFKDLNTAIALLGQYGIRGSTAGTSLRQVLSGLSGSTKKAKGVMQELGIITEDGANKFFDAQGKIKPLPEILDILNSATSKLTQKEKVDALKTMFNIRSLPTALNLMKEGSKGFSEMASAIDKTKAADVAAARMDNLSGDIEILKGNIDTLLIQAGTPFQNFLRGIVQGITNLVQWFGNLSPRTQELILKFVAISAAALILMGSFMLIVGTVLRFVSMMMDLKAVFTLLRPAIMIVTAAVRGFTLSLLTNPVFLIIAAIVALVVAFILLWKRSERFRNFMKGLWNGIKAAWNASLEWVKGLPDWFAGIWESIKSKTITAWNAITNFFTNTIPTKLSQAWNKVKQTTINAWNSVISFFQQLPGRIGMFVGGIVNSIIQFFAQLPYRLGFIIGFMAGVIVRGFINLGVWLKNIVVTIVTNVVTFFQELPGKLLGIFIRAYIWITAKWNALRARVVQIAYAIVLGITSFIQQLPGRVASFFSAMYTRAVSLLNTFRARAIYYASLILNGIINFFRQLPGRVAQFFSDTYHRAVQKLSELKNKAFELALGIYNNIKTWVEKIPGVISSAVSNAIQAFKNMITGAFNAAKDFASGLWNGFKKGLGINSPSLIEKQMVQITAVTEVETNRLKGQVRMLKDTSKKIAEVPFTYNQEVSIAASGSKVVSEAFHRNADQMKQLIELTAMSKTPSSIGASPTKQDILNGQDVLTTLNNLTAAVNNLSTDKNKKLKLVLEDGRELNAYVNEVVEDQMDEVITTVLGGSK